MDPATIVHQLRASGLYPAAERSRIRLYGDTSTMPPKLRESLRAGRAGVLDFLREPGQAIAYDIVHEASEAGWHPTVAGGHLLWHRAGVTVDIPPLAPPLVDALERHRAEVRRLLLDVPASCRDRACCMAAGICADEIRESACCLGSDPSVSGRARRMPAGPVTNPRACGAGVP